jgi:hypothetical protein
MLPPGQLPGASDLPARTRPTLALMAASVHSHGSVTLISVRSGRLAEILPVTVLPLSESRLAARWPLARNWGTIAGMRWPDLPGDHGSAADSGPAAGRPAAGPDRLARRLGQLPASHPSSPDYQAAAAAQDQDPAAEEPGYRQAGPGEPEFGDSGYGDPGLEEPGLEEQGLEEQGLEDPGFGDPAEAAPDDGLADSGDELEGDPEDAGQQAGTGASALARVSGHAAGYPGGWRAAGGLGAARKGEPYRPWFSGSEPGEPWFTADPGGHPG